VFFVAVGLFVLAAFAFLALFSYYLWVERYGDPAKRTQLNERFQEQLSLLPGANTGRSTVDIDITKQIHPHNPMFGNADASVTIIAFIDFECPYCRAAYNDFEQIRDQYGPAVNIVFKHFPVSQIHPHAAQAALAAQCAHEQNAFWEYYRLLFEKQQLSDDALLSYAHRLNLNEETFSSCLATNKYINEINQDLQDGINAGVRGTPTYLLNNQRIEGVTKLESWQNLIVEELQKS